MNVDFEVSNDLQCQWVPEASIVSNYSPEVAAILEDVNYPIDFASHIDGKNIKF